MLLAPTNMGICAVWRRAAGGAGRSIAGDFDPLAANLRFGRAVLVMRAPTIRQWLYAIGQRTWATCRPGPPQARRLVFETLEEKSLLAVLPAGFTETAVAAALSSPTALDIAPDGRAFVAEQNGAIRVVKNDALLPTPFASLTVDSKGERGLLGITLDPDFDH